MLDRPPLDLPLYRQAFGAVLREVREAIGLSQEQLALQVGVDRRRIWEWETATHSPGMDQILRLADALDVAVVYLFMRAEFLLRTAR